MTWLWVERLLLLTVALPTALIAFPGDGVWAGAWRFVVATAFVFLTATTTQMLPRRWCDLSVAAGIPVGLIVVAAGITLGVAPEIDREQLARGALEVSAFGTVVGALLTLLLRAPR